MQNRFGLKDLISIALIVLLIGVVVLGMKQLDRQWDVLRGLQDQGKEQTRLLASISRTLDDMASNGVAVSGGGATTQSAEDSAKQDAFFAPLKEAEKKPDFARGDFLVDNITTKIAGSLTPFIGHDLYCYWVQAKIFDVLITQDPNTFEYIPELARSWDISPDGMTLRFQLRRGVRFSDGEPLTADDVVYSYNFVNNPKINAPGVRSFYEKFQGMEKVNDYEVVVRMKEPYFNTLSVISGLYVLPKHFYSKFAAEEVNQNPGLVMGTGPYRLPNPASWRPGMKIELVRNEMYWGEAPAFDKLIYNEVQEEAAQETMFRNGDLDIYRCYAPQFDRLRKDPEVRSKAEGYAIDSFLNGYYFIGWNQKQNGKDTIFADKRVRKAMTLMTNRQGMCDEIYLGLAKPMRGPFWIGSPQEDPNLKLLPYDPAQGKKMLEEIGFSDRDGSGVLKSPAGVPLRFKLTYGTGNEFVQRVVLYLKDNFAKSGVILDADPQQWAVLNQRLQHRDFDAVFMGWGGGDVEQDVFQMFHSSQIEDAGDDFISYKNPALDKIIDKARQSVDRAERMKLWQECDRIIYEDQPYSFILARQETRFISRRIHNVQKTKAELNLVDLWTNPLPWYVPKGAQKYTQQ